MTNDGIPLRFWDDPARRASVIYVSKGLIKTIPAILRVPLHVKSKADHDPEYLSRGGRGSKRRRRLDAALAMVRRGLVDRKTFMAETLGDKETRPS